MKIYDLFTGIGGFSLAAKNALPESEVVLWSEIDKYSIQTYLKNFPEHEGKNIGDIARAVFDLVGKGSEANEFRVSLMPPVDLIMGGSPCQDLSIARGNRMGLEGEKSQLFWAFSELVRLKNPKYFLLENVASMRPTDRDTISHYLECEPVEINSVTFTGQKRKRLYWFNWKLVGEIPSWEEAPRREDLIAWSSSNDYDKETGAHLRKRERETKDGFANTLGTGKGCAFFSSVNKIVEADGTKRLLYPHECEELQGLPLNWTEGVKDPQRYKQVGNAITIPVVEYILRSIPKGGSYA